MRFLSELQARIQYKIIIPFFLLALLVVLAGASVALLVITGSAQDRLRNQLAQVARDASDRVVLVERGNLAFLRELAFAPSNPSTGALAVAEAIEARDQAGLEQSIDPYFRISADRGVRVDRLVAFDASGHTIIDWERERTESASGQWRRYGPSDLSTLWFVSAILSGKADDIGDKYAGLLDLGTGDRYLYTAAPVVNNGKVIGGLIAAINLDTLLLELNNQLQVAIVTVHQPDDGTAFASTASMIAALDELRVRPEVLPSARDLTVSRQQQGVMDTIRVNERDYQVAYAPLRVRETIIGVISFALSNDYVTGPWAEVRLPLAVLTIGLLGAIMVLGIGVARQITRPLQNLVDTAQAVIDGDLERRSQVGSKDEVGKLARAFNAMTGHLLTLYGTVRSEASQRAAIVESIADGILVLSPSREVLLVNPALREWLDLAPDQPSPARFADIPLRPLDEAALNYGSTRTSDLFQLGERIVRVSAAPIRADDGSSSGYVCVLQDLSSEVAIDRAKTNFIATISHELRTPLTVIGGNSDLLLSGLMGSLSLEQRELVEGIRRYTTTTTALINNMITIAGLDADSIPFDHEPVDVAALLDEALMSKRRALKVKNLQIQTDLPDDLPMVMADEIQLRTVFHQLIDNAIRYTDVGVISIRAMLDGAVVRIDIGDTGRGIEPALREQLFTRFIRGSEGINSQERGIGLGLAIARELLERQGGRIWLAETSEHGTTFSFTLQHANATNQTAELSEAQTA